MRKLSASLFAAAATVALVGVGAAPAFAGGVTYGGLSCTGGYTVISHSTTTGTTEHNQYSSEGHGRREWNNGSNLIYRSADFYFQSVNSVYIYKSTAGTPSGGRACG